MATKWRKRKEHVPTTCTQDKLPKSRCFEKKFIVSITRLALEKQQAIREMGFGSLLTFACRELRYKLCWWLISQYDFTYHRLNMGTDNVVSVNEEHVNKVMGIPSSGADLEGIHDLWDTIWDGDVGVQRNWAKFVLQYLEDGIGNIAKISLLTSKAASCSCKYTIYMAYFYMSSVKVEVTSPLTINSRNATTRQPHTDPHSPIGMEASPAATHSQPVAPQSQAEASLPPQVTDSSRLHLGRNWRWVNSVIIAIMSRMLNGQQAPLARAHYFDSSFSIIMDRCHMYLDVDILGRDLGTCDMMFLPVCENNHWHIHVVNFPSGRVEILSSLPLRRWNNITLHAYRIHMDLDVSTFVHVQPHLVQQLNGYNYGILALKFMEFWNGATLSTLVDKLHMYRLLLVVQLLLNERNSVRDKILASCQL
ncbi:hypothetical protein AAG906_028130 [Vitis piasezkii]